jgi:hypothetical protein
MPSPPPPYSPGQNHTISQAVGSSPHISSGAFPSQQNHPLSAHPLEYVPSPPSRPNSGYTSRPISMIIPSSAVSITSNPQFPPPPPPPNAKNRSASRDKLHSKFSLSNFRNRGPDHSPTPTAIDALRINTTEAIGRMPGSPGLPGQRMSQLYVVIPMYAIVN